MNAQPQPSERCPRCGGAFACGADAPGPCACSTVTLGAALLARLQTQFQGCLCLDCLRAMAGAQATGDTTAGTPKGT